MAPTGRKNMSQLCVSLIDITFCIASPKAVANKPTKAPVIIANKVHLKTENALWLS